MFRTAFASLAVGWIEGQAPAVLDLECQHLPARSQREIFRSRHFVFCVLGPAECIARDFAIAAHTLGHLPRCQPLCQDLTLPAFPV